jgi:hypothetical protein
MTVHDHSTRSSDEPVTQWTPPGQWVPPAEGQPPGTVGPGQPSGPAGGAPRKKNPKVAIAGALVAVAVASAGVTAGVMAATGSSSSSTAANGPGGGGGFGGAGGPGGGGLGGAATALHGTYVVSDGNGTYTTELTQTGTVSAVSAGSITVKSTDGYSKTYTITSSTSVDNGSDQISSVATGHTVRIVADSKASATTITDTNLSSSQNQGGQNLGGQNAGGQAGQNGNGQNPGAAGAGVSGQ